MSASGTRVPTRGELDAGAGALAAAVPGGVARQVSAADLGTYRLGGPIAVLARVPTDAALAAVSAVLAEHRPPVLVVAMVGPDDRTSAIASEVSLRIVPPTIDGKTVVNSR